jgi:hypothetical protein
LSAALHDWTFRHAISLIRHFSQLVAEGRVSTDASRKKPSKTVSHASRPYQPNILSTACFRGVISQPIRND